MRRIQVVLALLVLSAGLAPPAWAGASLQSRSALLPHCVVTAIETGVRSAEPPAPMRCFATFADAIAAATNGRVVLPADAQTVDDTTLNGERGPAGGIESVSATVIGIEYQHKYFGGWSYVIQSTNANGCLGYSYRVSSLPSSRNNEISSAKTYAGCKSNHYSGTNLTGSRYLCGCSQMGIMNDQTSSIFFSSSGYRSS